MDSQGKQRATNKVHAKFREFYPGGRIVVKDLRRNNSWWPGSVAERNRPKSYVVVLKDGRIWRWHVNHTRRDSIDSEVSKHGVASESQDNVLDPLCQDPLSTDVPLQPQLPANSSVMNPARS